MRTILVFTALLILTGASFCQPADRVLLFTKTAGFRHSSIPKGVETLSRLLDSVQLDFVHTEDPSYFCKDSLMHYNAVVFLNTSGDILSEDQKEAFQDFIQAGNGYVGIHAASDTEFDWPWYGQLVGGYFSGHPAIQQAELQIEDNLHPATRHLDKVWIHRDEWYDFKDVKEGLHILMTIDEKTYEGGKMGAFHPIAWFQEFDGGRSFYTGLGHTEESYDSAKFQKHILGGLFYVLKRN